MPAVIGPVGEARDDYAIFANLAEQLGAGAEFTEGRDASEWVRYMYETFRKDHPNYPSYEEFCEMGFVRHQEDYPGEGHRILLRDFREDPVAHPLNTPSGRIELFSETIDGFDYADCPGHSTWLEPSEWLGRPGPHPLHLTSNQPRRRLHYSSITVRTSWRAISGPEAVSIHLSDASVRGIDDGDVVRIFNERGACLAGAVVTEAVRPGVIQLATGAWYDPVGGVSDMCAHGNPNVLTRDAGTSSLAQGPVAHTCMVDVERAEDPPPMRAFELPEILSSVAPLGD